MLIPTAIDGKQAHIRKLQHIISLRIAKNAEEENLKELLDEMASRFPDIHKSIVIENIEDIQEYKDRLE